MAWLRGGASVPRQQVIRDFATSRAKARKDIKDGRLHLAGGIVLTVVWSRDLPAARRASLVLIL